MRNAIVFVKVAILCACLLSACGGNQTNTNSTSTPIPTIEKTPISSSTPVEKIYWTGDKYYFLTVGGNTYHGTKASETELNTCNGKKITATSGKLTPTSLPCGNFNLNGKRISKEDQEYGFEFENKACPSDSDDDNSTGKELAQAILEELVDVEPEGHSDGLNYMKVSLSLKVNVPINIVIPAGTLFSPSGKTSYSDKSTQRMMTIFRASKRLNTPGKKVCISVPVACIDIDLAVPTGGEGFSLGKTSEIPAELKKLLDNPEFLRESKDLQQGAIWIVRSNPLRNHREFETFADIEIKRMGTMLQEAQIPIEKYQIFKGLK